MFFRVLSLVVSLMLLSGVMVNASASAVQQHPPTVLAAIAMAPDELPVGDTAGGEPIETSLDIPDQLEVPSTMHGVAPRSGRLEPQLAASPTHPHLEGPQRPPRAAGHPDYFA